MVGRAVSNNRPGWILATKLANPMGDDPNRGGLSRRWVLQAADESLKRLGTDYIDIYYLHKDDHATPLEETVRVVCMTVLSMNQERFSWACSCRMLSLTSARARPARALRAWAWARAASAAASSASWRACT